MKIRSSCLMRGSRGQRHRHLSLIPLAVLAATLGCGGDANTAVLRTPTGPTQPAVPVYQIQLGRTSLALIVGQSAIVTATVRDGNGLAVVNPEIAWSSDVPSVARVSGSGNSSVTVDGVSPGSTVVRANVGTNTASVVVTVTVPTSPNGFAMVGNMTAARVWHTATLLRDGTVLVAGGGPNVAELYDPTTRTFTPTGQLVVGRANHAAVLLRDGRVLLAGGSGGSSAELYDPSSRTFARTGDMVEAQSGQTATLLPNGKVLITGGTSGESSCCPIAAHAELYDPATGVFTITGAYADTGGSGVYGTAGLVGVPATLLRDGRVLISAEPAAELFDPTTGTFSRTGAMATNPFPSSLGPPGYIAGRTASMLPNGNVLLAGGEHEDEGRFAYAELYDVSTGTFSLTGSMSVARDGHTATALLDGSVLITGGEGTDGCDHPGCAILSMSSAELYSPVFRAFTGAGAMSVPREWHVATLLADGTVLITGGVQFVGGLSNGSFSLTPLASAEIYSPTGTQTARQSNSGSQSKTR